MELQIKGMRLESVQFDNAPVLYFGERRDHILRVETVFVVRAGGEEVTVAFIASAHGGHSDPEGITQLVSLIHERVAKALVLADESLQITFDNKAEIRIPAARREEAWLFTYPGGHTFSRPPH
jgi:hypothetical protein